MKVEMIVLFVHWCPICNMMMPVVEEVETQYQEQLTVIRIDVEEYTAKHRPLPEGMR